ncbi:efflux RND transporter permease subunit [Candidatus Thiodictyon syntrophicum]|jgi:Cu(I)/Ag(I) efflux system membrane protein CusA/SilA|uniref:CusA/CzcA family heavy metal efflux RND transporter n=1 Tax=Candidatus Thiodictyon syntrophicum TaxID=1166950 RepID=A0A2K8U5Y1_9GAMM|nr:CusA/CzcA family heavy metal efflux RND transporter [Candidatus Thiodictyon syntrophicum]AUB80441.1 CusA/CzcA family heavy metal efflux RND transporter [Candidatus Thiodictyon syntrophicum]
MINRIIHWSLHHRFLVIGALVALCAWGVLALGRVPIDALPDLSENQVIVYADWPGRSPQEVEDQITYPLSVSLQGLAGVRTVRASSMFGFSFLTVIFADEIDPYFARTRVLERLNSLGELLPQGVTARLGPDATGLGWVYQYYLKDASGTQDLGMLRTLQDTYIRYQLAAVPGVAEVASIGGFVRQYQIEVSSLKLKQYGATLGEVMDAVTASNLNVGGKTIEENGAEFIVRGVGLVQGVADLEQVPVLPRDGAPLYLRDVATIRIGGDFRRGALDVDGREVVGGIVVMRYGENAYRVIKDVKARLAALAPGLPPGVTLVSFYDRSDLIGRAIGTLKETLAEEIALVILMHVLFLWHFRSILIVTLPLPASILIAFILMDQFGIAANIMSLTGIAISIGVLVDAGIVMTENVIRHCERAEAALKRRLNAAEVFAQTLTAATQVGRPLVYSMMIIILAFVPVFLLTGQEGKLFHPLAYTKTFALLGATLLAVTAVPVFCTMLVRGPLKPEAENWLMKGLLRLYEPVLDWALGHRKSVLGLAAGLLAVCIVIALGLPRAVNDRLPESVARHTQGFGSEFMPTLEEGSLLFMPVLLPATSLTEGKRIMAWQDQVIRAHPAVAAAAGKLGRATTATDPAPVEMIETTITLKPRDQWPPGTTKASIVSDLSARLMDLPGSVPGFLQPIENRILMTSTGIRAQVGVKVFGDDLDALQQQAFAIERVIQRVPGAVGVAPSRVQGKPYVEIEVRRDLLGRYGLSVAEVFRQVEAGIGGVTVGTTIKGRERWPLQVRLAQEERGDIDRLGEIPLSTPAGARVQLRQVADVKRVVGPNEIQSENGRLRVFVQANVRDRDLGSFVEDIKGRIAKEITLAPGMTIEYSGQYEQQLRARQTLLYVFPTVILIIFATLVMTFRSIGEAAHVILAVPFALTGGVLLQAFLGFNFSVAVWVGYIALFGTAIQTGIIMVTYLEESVQEAGARLGRELTRPELIAAVKAGARLRLRPKVMTVATTIAALSPIFWLQRTGVEIMQPLATPVVGGMISSLVHILIVTPVIFLWLRERGRPARAGLAATGA